MMSWSSKPQVRKQRSLACPKCHPVVWADQPWVVINHHLGSRTFDTWAEAMAYARNRPMMINGYMETMHAAV